MKRPILILLLIFMFLVAACRPQPLTDEPSSGGEETDTGGEEMAEDAIGFIEVPDGEPVHIAYMLATSGAVEFLGADSLGGIEIAITHFGDVHGHEIKLSGEDSLCSAEGGQTAAQKVASDPTVAAVIGTNCSSAGTAASVVLSQAGLVMMSPTNTSPALTDPDQTWQPGYFRTAHNDLFQGAVAAEFAFNELGATTAAAIHDGDPYTEGLASSFRDAFEGLGGTIVAFEAVNKGDTDMRPVLTSIGASAPEILYFPIFEPEGNFVAAQTLEVPGLAATTLMGADGLLVKSFGPNTGSAADGMYLSGPYISAEIDAYAAFLAEYDALTGGPPPAGFAAHAYDATTIVLNAIAEIAIVHDDGSLSIGRQALRDAVTATSGYSGLTGVLSCGDKELTAGVTNKGDCATGEALAVFQLTGAQVASEDNWPAPVVYTPSSGASELTSGQECALDLTGEQIVIYQNAGREGPIASILGEAFAFATADAVNEINAAGGICGAELVVEFRETNYNVDLEVQAYEEVRAATPEAFLVQTYASGATVALNERVIEDQIVNMAAGLNAQATYVPRDGWTVLIGPIYSDQFAGFMEFVVDNWDDIKPEGAGDDVTVGVIGWANAYGAGATTPESIAYVESLGVTVLPLEEQEISPEADVTGQIQNMLLSGANVIYQQNLSFSTAQVIGTVRALGAWDSVVMGGVNWSGNTDVINFLGENAALMDGYYAMYPWTSWDQTDNPGVQMAEAAFAAGGHPDSEKSNTYLATYGGFYNTAVIIEHAINLYGWPVTGETFFDAFKDLGTVNAIGLIEFNVAGEDRAPRSTQIRQARLVDGMIVYEVVQDWTELPDTRPPAP
jgi:branched-chain amino acid transport system substrate-binding protein